MDVRLVTSHQFTVPQVREVAPQASLKSPSVAQTRSALSQRDLVAASLIACPGRSGAATKRVQ